jgi:electron transfer flavoprotein beta subunit
MKAKKKPLDVTSLAELGVIAPAERIRTLKFEAPAQRSRGVMVKDAAELLAALTQRGVL